MQMQVAVQLWNAMSIKEAGQKPLFPAHFKKLTYTYMNDTINLIANGNFWTIYFPIFPLPWKSFPFPWKWIFHSHSHGNPISTGNPIPMHTSGHRNNADASCNYMKCNEYQGSRPVASCGRGISTGLYQNGPWTKTAPTKTAHKFSICPKRPTARSKTAHTHVQNGPWQGLKRPTD